MYVGWGLFRCCPTVSAEMFCDHKTFRVEWKSPWTSLVVICFCCVFVSACICVMLLCTGHLGFWRGITSGVGVKATSSTGRRARWYWRVVSQSWRSSVFDWSTLKGLASVCLCLAWCTSFVPWWARITPLICGTCSVWDFALVSCRCR